MEATDFLLDFSFCLFGAIELSSFHSAFCPKRIDLSLASLASYKKIQF